MLKPEDVDLVIAHGHCPDGFGAAWSAWTMHNDKIQYFFASYGDEKIPDVEGRNVLMVDFAYKSIEVMNDLNAKANSMLLLDHHKSAKEALEGKIDCDHIFDMNRSGARMAWDYFYPDQKPPCLILYVEDRDIWKWEYPESRAFLAALDSYEYSFQSWDKFAAMVPDSDEYAQFLREGLAIMRAQKNMVDSAVKKAVAGWIKTPDGQQYPAFAVNSTAKELTSDVGHELSGGKVMGLVWGYSHERDHLYCSLRSIGETDVSEVAKKFGGGGHKNASGFEYAGNIKDIFEMASPEMSEMAHVFRIHDHELEELDDNS